MAGNAAVVHIAWQARADRHMHEESPLRQPAPLRLSEVQPWGCRFTLATGPAVPGLFLAASGA
jgi:hypothetical protein